MAEHFHARTLATAAPATAELWIALSPFGATDDRRVTVADFFGATPATAWGEITGTLSAQTDLSGALDGKTTLTAVKEDADIADAITKKHANTLDHSNTNDPTAEEKAALAGTNGIPSETNKFLTNTDSRNTDARTPTSHAHPESEVTNLVDDLASKETPAGAQAKVDTHKVITVSVHNFDASGNAPPQTHNQDASTINAGTLDGDRLPALSTTKKGAAPATGTPSGKFLKDDGTWATPAGGGITTLKKTANQTINAGAATFVDITGLTFPVTAGVDYAFYFYITFRSAQLTTGWKSGVNHPGGTLDFWAKSAVIANGAAGVATHTERHNVSVDDMTLLTATITNNVDLSIIIEGRYMCTANGTFAARFANELAANTDLVVQKGSWGWYF